MSVVELVCIKLGESATFAGGKVFEKPAAPAASAALKAEREAVQLWGRGRLAILNLPRICRTCRICPRRDRFMDEPDTPVSEYGAGLEQPAAAGLVSFDSEYFPHGVAETTGAVGAETVEDAPVLVCVVQLGEEVAWHGFVRL